MPPLTFLVRGRGGSPVAGAAFALSTGARAVSDAGGVVNLGALPAGEHGLYEISPAPGYIPHRRLHRVTVSARGEVLVDGVGPPSFCVQATPWPCLRFLVRDAQDSQPLPGAWFALSSGRAAVSDGEGAVDFGPLPPGQYVLEETAPPCGYLPNRQRYQVVIPPQGTVLVQDIPAPFFSVENRRCPAFSFAVAHGGGPVAGAGFRLAPGGRAASDGEGAVRFGPLGPGVYTLAQDGAPEGFLVSGRTYRVVADDAGRIAVDGMEMAKFRPTLLPLPALSFFTYGGEGPLAGAAFALSSGREAVSDGAGRVSLGPLAPGVYYMSETGVPAGYELPSHLYRVVVKNSGEVEVDGRRLPAFSVKNDRFPPAPPVVSPIQEGDFFITGTGVPRAAVYVTLPSGCVRVGTANAAGGWIVPIPLEENLCGGDLVGAYQVEAGAPPSETVSAMVAGAAYP